MAKPSKLPSWDTTEVNSTEPDPTHQDEGWLAPGGIPEKPPFQTFNHWMNAVWKWLKEFNKQGVVEWDAITSYDTDDISKGSDGKLYSSLVDTNTNNDPISSPSEWELVVPDMASTADAQAGISNSVIINPARLHDAIIGSVLQAWTIVTGSRAVGVVYTNTTGRPIMIAIECTNNTAFANAQMSVDSIQIYQNRNGGDVNQSLNLYAIVPNGSTYSIAAGVGVLTIDKWSELR